MHDDTQPQVTDDAQDTSTIQSDDTSADHSALQQKVMELEAHVTKLTDIAARSQADLQNIKERAKKEAEELRQFAAAPVLSQLLPCIDDVFRIGDHLDAEGPVRAGYDQLCRKLLSVLEELGLQKIATTGEKVDPARHEVLNTAPGEKDVILAVYEEGYELRGRVLRPAKVQVGNGE